MTTVLYTGGTGRMGSVIREGLAGRYDRVVLYAQPGALPEAALEDLIKQISEVDMDQVREQIAAEAKAS